MAGVGDLERSIARLQAAGTGRDADNVVLYEDVAKRRVTALASFLQGLQSLQVFSAVFQSDAGTISSWRQWPCAAAHSDDTMVLLLSNAAWHHITSTSTLPNCEHQALWS